MVSSIPRRGSSLRASSVARRLFRRRTSTASRISRSGCPATSSAAPSVNPPTKTARLVELLLHRLEELVAPLDRAAERPLALGQAGARRGPEEIEPRVETLEQRTRREQVAARSSKLESQRKPVEADANLRNGLGVGLRELEVGPGRPRSIDEQPDRLGPAQPGDRGTRDRSGSSSAGPIQRSSGTSRGARLVTSVHAGAPASARGRTRPRGRARVVERAALAGRANRERLARVVPPSWPELTDVRPCDASASLMRDSTSTTPLGCCHLGARRVFPDPATGNVSSRTPRGGALGSPAAHASVRRRTTSEFQAQPGRLPRPATDASRAPDLVGILRSSCRSVSVGSMPRVSTSAPSQRDASATSTASRR